MIEAGRVADFDGWTTSIATLFGKSPKITCLCGKCRAKQSMRFDISLDFNYRGRPTYHCNRCGQRNYVPIIVEASR